MSASMTAKQMRTLLQSISTDPQLKQSKDSILLAEDQYPEHLDTLFNKLSVPTTLQNTMILLQWNRNLCDSSYDAALKSTSITNQDYLRQTYQLIPTADNPWDLNTFRRWKYFVTNLCLSAVQDAMKAGDYGKSQKYLFQPDTNGDNKAKRHDTKSNVQGLLLYHPILLNSPWQAPEDLDAQVGLLLSTTEPILWAKAGSEDPYTMDAARKHLEVLKQSIKNLLDRVYTITSHSFHVLLRDLIPHARQDNSYLFTHIKGARTDHIIALRAHHGKKREGLPPLNPDELKPHSAQHTLQFIEDEYVEKDDDASHYTWGDILTATRMPKISIFAWVDSFTLLTLRYGETVDEISVQRQSKINRVVAKQITDDEKLIIATLQSAFTAVNIHNGVYPFSELVKLLAQNVTSFTKRYTPHEHPRIMQYLKTRSKRQVILPTFTNPGAKGGQGNAKRVKVQKPSQRRWTFLQEPTTGLVPPAPYQPKGKGKGKGKFKGKPKGKGKPASKGMPKGKPKGKGLGKGKGKLQPKGNPPPTLSTFPSKPGEPQHGHLKCHFCHVIGHIKPNCRKWLALQTSDQYKQRNSHEPKYQLIYDHLEDSVFAPRLCQYCSDSNCDGENCESPFDHDDYHEASMFFTQTLSSLVVNAKLERPLDSHAPQTEHVYAYVADDWGNGYEDEYDPQWDNTDNQWESSDNNGYEYGVEDTYTAEAVREEENITDDQNQDDSEDYDEDDQDQYM